VKFINCYVYSQTIPRFTINLLVQQAVMSRCCVFVVYISFQLRQSIYSAKGHKATYITVNRHNIARPPLNYVLSKIHFAQKLTKAHTASHCRIALWNAKTTCFGRLLKVKGKCSVQLLVGNLSQSYGASPTIWNHSVLTAPDRWTRLF